MRNPDSPSSAPSPREFTTTHWSVVLLAGGPTSVEAEQALDQLCRIYWYPLYAYVRRQGCSADDAQDLTQGFFARLLEKNYVQLADPQRGRFRTFLLSSLKNFLTTEWKKSCTQKHGGAYSLVSWEELHAEDRYLAEPVDGLTPELIYEKSWAVMLLKQAMARLRDRYAGEGKEALFDALSPYVWADTMADGYASIAEQLGQSEGALRVAMHRLRESFGEQLRVEVARTVESSAEVEQELRYLIATSRK